MFEYSSIPQTSDLNKCRLCFDNQTSLIHIFETTGSLNEEARTISEVLNFEVSAEDHFPPFVCSYCSAKLFDFKAFKAKCYSLRETYKLILQRKAESVREVSPYNVSPLPMKVEDAVVGDGIGVSEQIEIEQDPKVSPYNEESLPLKVENTVNDDRIGVSEQVEREQKSKHSALNVAECPIKTELVEDEMFKEAEMSEEAENDPIPERHEDSPHSRMQVWFQMNPAESEVHVRSEQSNAENVPESSSYHMDGYPISNRKLGAEGEVIYSGTCSSVSGMDFPVGAADVTIPEMDNKSSGHSEAYGYHAGSYKPQKKDVTRVNPPNWDEEVFGGWRIDDSREEESNSTENRNISPSNKGNSGVAAEMVNDMEYVRCHHCRESKLTKDELKRHIYSAHPSLFMDEVISTDNDFEENYAEIDGQTEELEELQSTKSCNINSSDCLAQMDMNYENVFSKNRSSVVSPSGISGKNEANKEMREKSVKDDLFTKKETFFSLKSKSGDNSAKSESSSSEMAVQTKRKPFVCDVCKKSFGIKRDMGSHVRVHYDDRPYKCRECGQSFKHEVSKIEHELRHLKKRKENEANKKRITEKCHMCEICKKEFSSRDSLYKHSNLHKNKYSCTFCGKRCRSKYHLDNHSRMHTNEKPFSCGFCKRTFNWEKSLKIHITSHSNNRSFQCNFCDKRFKTKQNKNQHELYHLRSK